MTQKIYRSARGKQVDIGSMRLQNENVRAVGNMGVNARGDRIDSQGNVIDSKGQQLQRRIQRQTNVSDGVTHTSARHAKESANDNLAEKAIEPIVPQVQVPIAPSADPIVEAAPEQVSEPADESGGLAAAIARAKIVKQELEKTPRQQQQSKPVRKI